MAEWSNAAVLKTVVLSGTGGSNPSPSALQRRLPFSGNLFLLEGSGASPARFASCPLMENIHRIFSDHSVLSPSAEINKGTFWCPYLFHLIGWIKTNGGGLKSRSKTTRFTSGSAYGMRVRVIPHPLQDKNLAHSAGFCLKLHIHGIANPVKQDELVISLIIIFESYLD